MITPRIAFITGLALLGSVGLTSLPAQAQSASGEEKAQSTAMPRDLEVGSRLPDGMRYEKSNDNRLNWKKLGLEDPGEQGYWVEINGKYVQVEGTNGQITKIVPKTK